MEAVDSARGPALVLPLLSVWYESFDYVVTFLRQFAPLSVRGDPENRMSRVGWARIAECSPQLQAGSR
jgi:hypothetical protein